MDYPWLPQAPRVCHSFTSEVLETKPPTVRMTMLTPLHQERLQDGRNQSGPRGTAMPSFGKTMKTDENHGKHGLPCRWWVWQSYILFILMNSEFGVFEHVLVKTTELPCWLNEVCKAHSDHIVTLLNEKGASQHILVQLEINKFEHLSENCLKNIRKKGVLKWALEVSKHSHYHWCHWYRFAKPADKQLNAS